MSSPIKDRSPPPRADEGEATSSADPVRWLEEHGDWIFRYAFARTRDRSVAEDLVQETLLAAIEAAADFRGRSTVRTWLTGILRRKIIDHYRRQERDSGMIGLESIESEIFGRLGKWRRVPKRWADDPDDLALREEFRQVLRDCLAKLPPAQAEVFLLRERENLTAEELGKVVHTSASNIWVMLHRSRLALRECLERNWVRGRGGGSGKKGK